MRYKNIAVSLLSGTVLVACCSSGSLPHAQTVNSAQQPVTEKHQRIERGNAGMEAEMRELVGRNPQEDAAQAIKAGDRRLWAYHQRNGQHIPGIQSIDGQSVSTRIAPGMSDTIHGRNHLELRKQLLEYMRQYNQRIMELR